MADKSASPRAPRGDSPPPRKRSRSDDRSQSPRSHRDRQDRDNHRRSDNYRSRDDDRNRGTRHEPGRNRNDENKNDPDRLGQDVERQRDNRGEKDSDRRDADRSEGRDRDRPRPKKNFGGFKFKDKRRDEFEDRGDDRRGGSFRGYRNRSPSPRRRDRDRDRDRDRERDTGASSSTKKSKSKSTGGDTSQPPVRAPAAPSGGGEEMIIVHINDRLGTKAAIPCFASDRIKEFKIMVAARIGREPHEILLKRQGQRPFKDMLTLADYEISNGVQLDLEVDTGD
ncbi:ubiquitin-like protein [Daldinia decipiens]|uniref:ubiquitin-like protein n=1 Tax=Daldinia decipiens TaxID=326647 RepID=UPI0020C36D6F|nr:ubiquitin-like protein [Daldinia decipiens]KAI1659156.1 ubiquitin-like protein [Daldinia decipiens]